MTTGIFIAAVVVAVAAGLAGWRAIEAALRRRRLRELQTRRTRETVFRSDGIADWPEPARRYFQHTFREGAILPEWVELSMRGAMQTGRSGRWRSFQGEEVIHAARGFLWSARWAGPAGLPISGLDYYYAGRGGTRRWLFDLIPVVRADGGQVALSAAGRFLAEALWLPAILLPGSEARWQAIDGCRARVAVTAAHAQAAIILTLTPEGGVQEIRLARGRGRAGEVQPFRLAVDREQRFGNYTIPSVVRAGWGDTSGEFTDVFRAEITSARFL